ncbi:uncharacterized protein LOC131535396, partial [Onychostoma macrolepis]|uniref:uncharacterized protein LOC131535396 n=1 Tax=Onychostoma macrolepis TaxID=369639 RepID=UPI00272B0539
CLSLTHIGITSVSPSRNFRRFREASTDSGLIKSVNITRNSVRSAGDLHLPTLSLTSRHAAVSPGENIQFNCTTPKPRCNATAEFQLFRNGSSVSSQTHVSSVTFNLVNVYVSHQGSYSCCYSYQNNNYQKKSPLSNTVIINVVNLQQPSISHSAPDGWFHVGPQGPVINRGHSFTIICSIQSQYPGGSFYLFRGSSITRTESAVSHSASFFFPEADFSQEGNYSCVYEVSVSSRSFRSSASELLLITITVNLQQPSIDPDGWFHVGPQGPVITRGHSFTIICSIQSQYPGGSFHLFRGSNITRTESAVSHSASFFFPEADYLHEGNYSCVYEVSVSSRSFRSSASELLLITITASLLPVIGAAVSAVLLLLSVLIIILLLKRRQRQRNKETHLKCCFRKGEAASHSSKNEEDDEADYENFELDENMDHDESEQDYINVDSDHSEQDYVNVHSDDSEDCVNGHTAKSQRSSGPPIYVTNE